MRQKFDRLSAAGKRLARIPRFGRLLGQMTEEQLALIDSRGATYFQLLSYVGATSDKDKTGLIDSGLNTAGAELLGFVGSDNDAAQPGTVKPNRANPSTRQWQAKLALRILGAVAFEMYCHNQRFGQAPTTPIEGDLQAFKVQVCQRVADAGAYCDQMKRPIDVVNLIENDFLRIEQMNALGLEYAVLSSTGEAAVGFGDPRRQLLFFADISIQAFLAAYWAVNWTNSAADVVSVSHWIPDPISNENSVYQEFWEMVLEMPQDAVDTQRFQSMLSPLYNRNLQPDPNLPIRSTELIYRSWDRMQGTAAQAAFQNEFAALVAAQDPVAKGLLYTETGESAFIQLADLANPRDKWDTGKFFMGDEFLRGELQPQTVESFRLHRYCVTNQEYECFDPRHAQRRAFTDAANIERHPVVNVSWFDAWCYAKWLSGFELVDGAEKRQYQIGLPTEIQWECGCRCGETTPFTWWDRQNGERCQSGDCNFNSNFPWPRNQASVVEPIYLKRTIGVDGLDAELSVRANPWGLCQMHGNVWEWTESWYTKGLSRVRRGGSWFSDGEFCRSGLRVGNVPSDRVSGHGFRLAAVLVSNSSRSPVGGAAT